MKTITASFRQGAKRITASECMWQYDYGHTLNIQGLDLPEVFEADFSSDPCRGDSITVIGMDNSVSIPDMYLESGEPVYVFFFLHEGEYDGETEYRILIPVEKRPARTAEEPDPEEQSIITQTIAALNVAADRAADQAQDAEDAKNAILNLSVEAETLSPGSDAEVHKLVDPESGEVTLVFGIPEGKQGDRGTDGKDGKDGKDGSKGDAGDKGDKGDTGAVFTPSVSSSGILSWTNNGGLNNPDSFDIVSAVLNELPIAEEGQF